MTALPESPDFDVYPVRRAIADAQVDAPADGRAVAVTWDDGVSARYSVFWLRENAPDPETTHPETREQRLQLLEIPEDLRARAAWIDAAGALCVAWSTGEESRFHPGWLRAWTFEASDADPALPPRIAWEAGATAAPRFDGPKALSDEAEQARWLEALHVHGVAILEGLDATPEVIETVPRLIGPIRETNFGPVFDVRSKTGAAATSNAYTAMTLPVHVDLATREYVPGLQFLHCLQNDARGGDSILADGRLIAETLRARDPEAFDALTRWQMTFYNKARDSDYRFDAPMIELDDAGEVDAVRWSPWLRAPVRAPFEVVDALYRGMRALFQMGEDPAFQATTKLRSGDLLGFDNRRVLHGRTGFDPSTGGRWLRGCYVEREELWSRLRILRRHAREAEIRGARAA